MTSCPLCRLPMKQVGRYVEARDDAGLFFVFELCMRCRMRLDRLPRPLQRRQHEVAIRSLVKAPERYRLMTFETEIEARLYSALASEFPSFPSSAS